MTKRNAIITGGARGIGAATARALAADGHRVFINFVNSTQAATILLKRSRVMEEKRSWHKQMLGTIIKLKRCLIKSNMNTIA